MTTKILCIFIFLFLTGCAPSVTKIENDGSILFESNKHDYYKELIKYAIRYYVSGVLNYNTNVKIENITEEEYMKDISDEVLSYFPEKYHHDVVLILKRSRKAAIEHFGNEMSRLTNDEISVQAIRGANQGKFESKLSHDQENFRAFAKVSQHEL